MRRYNNDNEKKLIQVVCNQCKKELKIDNGYLKEGCFTADYSFGYFSRKDGTKHQFDLCEDCYDRLVAQFAVLVDSSQEKELL